MVKKATAVAGEPAGHDCGPDGNLNILTGNAVGRGAARTVDTLYWAVIPATWTFQVRCFDTRRQADRVVGPIFSLFCSIGTKIRCLRLQPH